MIRALFLALLVSCAALAQTTDATAVFEAASIKPSGKGQLTGGTAKGACDIAATVSPTKSSYVRGEPIELQLTLTNKASSEASFLARYPWFNGPGHGGIKLAWQRGGIVSSPSDGVLRAANLGGRASIIPLGPGESWSVKVFMQRFLPDPPDASSEVSFAIDIPCYEGGHAGSGRAAGHGVFGVVVLDSSSNELTSAIDGYGKRMKSEDFWERRASAEALFVASTPIVIPYLRALAQRGEGEPAIEAFGKFRGNDDALKALIETLHGNRVPNIEAALDVLGRWNYACPRLILTICSPEPTRS